MVSVLLLTAVLLPVLGGVALPFLKSSRKNKCIFMAAVLGLEAAAVALLAMQPAAELFLFSMTEQLQVRLRMDAVSKLFMCVSAFGYLLAGIFAFRYMDHEEKEGSFKEEMFFSFFLLSLGALVGMDLSSNLVTMYFFFEMVTVLSMPLVLFERTEESINAALKYLFYSIAGAFLALGGIFFIASYSTTIEFAAGGNLDMALVAGHENLLRIIIMLAVVGFGAKAGMYPLHGWLPTAHPVAPAPASAVLSGIITKAGVIAIIRIIYFTVGTEFIRGTWVQYTWLSLALLTVFMGSMMAFREKVFKKRLAYSSVSQISYVLFGLFLMNETAAMGSLMQVLFHASVKICLFLTAGSLIYNTGFHDVDEFRGLGKYMPKTFGAFTMASLSLVGIPPFAGFVSKWYLAEGALVSGTQTINWLGPVILLISALLTAGYLLPITVGAFFPGKSFKDTVTPEKAEKYSKEGGLLMIVPLFILAGFALAAGCCSSTVHALFEHIVECMFM